MESSFCMEKLNPNLNIFNSIFVLNKRSYYLIFDFILEKGEDLRCKNLVNL